MPLGTPPDSAEPPSLAPPCSGILTGLFCQLHGHRAGRQEAIVRSLFLCCVIGFLLLSSVTGTPASETSPEAVAFRGKTFAEWRDLLRHPAAKIRRRATWRRYAVC